MAYSKTGFFRVCKVKNSHLTKGFRYAYQMKNELINTDIRSTSILKLKEKVVEAGLLWGITDMERAIQTANENETPITQLEGRYGLKMKGDSK